MEKKKNEQEFEKNLKKVSDEELEKIGGQKACHTFDESMCHHMRFFKCAWDSANKKCYDA